MIDIDLDTLLVMIYVFVDEWYQEHIKPLKSNRGRPVKCSDSEILTLAVVSEWRCGVSWESERGFVRYMHKHYGEWFPQLPQRSGFNKRKRGLMGVLVQLQAYLVNRLSDKNDIYECVDCLPIPAGSLGQYTRDKGHWLWDSSVGKGKDGWFWGDHLLAAVRPSGVISGYLLGAAHINDRWLMEAFLSARQGCPRLIGPPDRVKDGYGNRRVPPIGFIGAWSAVGDIRTQPYLADKGFNGYRWYKHWDENFQAQVYTVPPDNSKQERPWTRPEKKWLASKRQIVETAFAILTDVFKIKQLRAHSRWGQYTRIAAKMVGYHFGIWINRLLGRNPLSHATLIC